MSEEGERDLHDPEDRWCVECHRNVFPRRGGSPLDIAVSITLLLVLGAVIGIGLCVLLSTDVRPGIFAGAFLGVLLAVVVLAASPQTCPICRSKNLKDAR
jgi:hypothetical protein